MANLKNKEVTFTEALKLLKEDALFSEIYKALNVKDSYCEDNFTRIINQNKKDFRGIQFDATFARAIQVLGVNITTKEFITLLKTLIYENLDTKKVLAEIDKKEKEDIEAEAQSKLKRQNFLKTKVKP